MEKATIFETLAKANEAAAAWINSEKVDAVATVTALVNAIGWVVTINENAESGAVLGVL